MPTVRTFSGWASANRTSHLWVAAVALLIAVSVIGASAQNLMTRNYEAPSSFSINRGDFNNDGILDVVIGQSSLSVLLGGANGAVSKKVLTQGAPVFDLAVGDLNRDGRLDVATVAAINPGNQNAVQIWLGNGDGSFRLGQSQVSDALLSSITTGDFDNDGNLDLVTCSDTITVWRGAGDGTFAPVASLPLASLGNQIHSVRVGDFDGDGRVDFAARTFNDIVVFWNDGGFKFSQTRVVSAAEMWDVTPVDVNQDSFTDLVFTFDGCPDIVPNPPGRGVGCPTWTVYLSQGDGSRRFRLEASMMTGTFSGSLQSPTAADINGDGINDIVMLGPIGVRAWLGNPDENYQTTSLDFITGTDKSSFALVPGDFNRDGRIDFAVSNPGDSTVSLMLNAIPRANCQIYTLPGSVTVCKPQDYTYLNSPVSIVGTATDIEPITATQIYVDNVLFINMAAATLDQLVNLPAGEHLIVTKGWDVSGRSFRSDRHVTVFNGAPGETCSTKPQSITMCLPGADATSGTALRILAAAQSDAPVTSVQVYIDNKLEYDDQSLSNYVDHIFNVSPGGHFVVAKAWDASGRNFSDSRVVSVR